MNPDYRSLKGTGAPWGIINNNPFNLDFSDAQWRGKVLPKTQRFEVFIDIVLGMRAGLTSAMNRFKANGSKVYDYIAGVPDPKNPGKFLLPGYAPASDKNNCDAYIANICHALNVDAHAKVVLTRDLIFKLAWAHLVVECGWAVAKKYITDDMVNAAIDLITDLNGKPVFPKK
jgi:hypothetical protein